MKDLTLAFTDFWTGFDIRNNFFTQVLGRKYNVSIVEPHEKPDIHIYSFFGIEHLRHDNLKLYYTGENDVPNFNFCDYAISFHHLSLRDRHLRLPLYVIYPAFERLRSQTPEVSEASFERDFCSVLISNDNNCDSMRLDFLNLLNGYRKVASGGRYANNVGGPVDDKLEFISDYKFNLAFENSLVYGYTTEKIIDPLGTKTVPIYWGNPDVELEVNPKSFINIHKFDNINKALEYIKYIDNNPAEYLEMLSSNPIENSPYLSWEEMLLDFIDNIIERKTRYVTNYGAIGTIVREQVKKERIYIHKTIVNNIDTIEKISKLWRRIRRFQ